MLKLFYELNNVAFAAWIVYYAVERLSHSVDPVPGVCANAPACTLTPCSMLNVHNETETGPCTCRWFTGVGVNHLCGPLQSIDRYHAWRDPTGGGWWVALLLGCACLYGSAFRVGKYWMDGYYHGQSLCSPKEYPAPLPV